MQPHAQGEVPETGVGRGVGGGVVGDGVVLIKQSPRRHWRDDTRGPWIEYHHRYHNNQVW